MRHGSLFSGIGGPDLAAEWMGWENVFHCEINPFGQKILKYYWPNSISYENITTADFTIHRGRVDILTGGFPCQPFSHAGNRQGVEDDRYLWPEMLRAISEIRPTWVVGENVAGIRSMGIEQSYSTLESDEVASIQEVMVIEEIRKGLEEIGYELQPFIIPACAVNAPHRRDRVWFVAYSSDARIESVQRAGKDRVCKSKPSPDTDNQECKWGGSNFERERKEDGQFQQRMVGSTTRHGEERSTSETKDQSEWSKLGYVFESPGEYSELNKFIDSNSSSDRRNGERERFEAKNRQEKSAESRIMEGRPEGLCSNGNIANSNDQRIQGRKTPRYVSKSGPKCQQQPRRYYKPNNWREFPTQSPVCNGNDGISSRLDGITFSKWRNESIKAGGNAIVPQVIYQIFKAIEQYELTQLK